MAPPSSYGQAKRPADGDGVDLPMKKSRRFAAACLEMYGPRWKTRIARVLMKDTATIWRYVTAEEPLPDHVMDTVSALLTRHRGK